MKDQDRYFQKILGAYTVAPADETDMQKTILAGKQLLMKNPVQELAATLSSPCDFKTSIIIRALSDSEEVDANFSLKSSSLIPAQFSASAKVPVTLPT